jgi:hypothetical protein
MKIVYKHGYKWENRIRNLLLGVEEEDLELVS